MNALSLKDFQEQVGELLLRHRSLLDVLSKFQQSNAGVNRSVIKSITECGCVEVNAKKQEYSPEMTLDQAKIELQTHLEGQLCEHCMEAISTEIGKHLFYLSALSNLLDVNLEKVLEDESKKCSTLGFFNMS